MTSCWRAVLQLPQQVEEWEGKSLEQGGRNFFKTSLLSTPQISPLWSHDYSK